VAGRGAGALETREGDEIISETSIMTVGHIQCTIQRVAAVRRPSSEAGYCVCIMPVIGMRGAMVSPSMLRKMLVPISTHVHLT
jgi:hypothetical protein